MALFTQLFVWFINKSESLSDLQLLLPNCHNFVIGKTSQIMEDSIVEASISISCNFFSAILILLTV